MPDQPPTIRIETVLPAKPWWRSRTMWFNALCLAAAAAEPQLGAAKDVLPGGLYAWLAFVLPIGNAVLRGITTTGVTR